MVVGNKEDSVQDDQQNLRNREDELVQYINCHAKHSAVEGPDVLGHQNKQGVAWCSTSC